MNEEDFRFWVVLLLAVIAIMIWWLWISSIVDTTTCISKQWNKDPAVVIKWECR